MRCVCCNKNLSDFEATRKHALTGDFLDMCQRCFRDVSEDVDLPVIERKDLVDSVDIEEGLDKQDDDVLQYNFKEDKEV